MMIVLLVTTCNGPINMKSVSAWERFGLSVTERFVFLRELLLNLVADNVLERVEAEQNRWMRKVEEQRRNIFTDHTMLN